MTQDLLTESGLRMGPDGISRSTYSFRHTSAALRPFEGVDVYILADSRELTCMRVPAHIRDLPASSNWIAAGLPYNPPDHLSLRASNRWGSAASAHSPGQGGIMT